MPLLIAPYGVELRVVRVHLDEKTKKRLESLGLTIDTRLTILSQGGEGAIVLLKGTRVALDRDLASRIFVAQAA